MGREIKFRAWHHGGGDPRIQGHMTRSQPFPAIFWHNVENEPHAVEVMQFTGLKDKNGVEIYEGDIIKIRTPARSYDDHYGENIPGPTNTFRQYLEPVIREERRAVSFKDGCFCVGEYPLSYEPLKYSAEEAKELFEARHGAPWDDAEEGDLQYLLAEYGFGSEEELLASLGYEVIGNIHQNPDLLEAK